MIIMENPIGIALAGANAFLRASTESVARYERFCVALSGGHTPELMFDLLSKEPFISGLQWEKMFFFWVDERCVPFNDPSSNFGMAGKYFLNHVPVPRDHIYPMPAEMDPEEGAITYWKTLSRFFKIRETEVPVFDLIFLGIGDDGHTASLFPGQSYPWESERPVIAVKGGDPRVCRLTLNYRVINHAREIIFLASGKGKASILKSLFENGVSTLPVNKIHPVSGRLIWIIDREAASLLSENRSNNNVAE